MRNKKGQATILIGIIFQVVFIFFAMVINVGLLVNDKINLQNSVDIAAYYGAMKQAEVLNTMAHVNFQIRQAWKLMNWRLWALGDIGRFQRFIMEGKYLTATDIPLVPDEPDTVGAPAVCVRNPFWFEEFELAGGSSIQNFCKKPVFSIPKLKPLTLSPVQMLPIFSFMHIFKGQSEQNAGIFNKDCARGGELNHYYATTLITSYKMAVAHRRNAMRALQNLLIGDDLIDIRGKPVRETTDTVFKKNLTLANRESIENFEFVNSLKDNPFLVPIDVRVLMNYTDILGNGNKCTGEIKDLQTAPDKAKADAFAMQVAQLAMAATQSDYGENKIMTAEAFSKESKEESYGKLRSLVGFEKNPWVLAYVKVSAKTKPKMLFSPIGDGRVTLTAESYAMPFGGRIGPWYKASWQPDQPMSSGAPEEKIDKLLSPRIGEATGGQVASLYKPNYSRYPGDTLGMESALARAQGMSLAYSTIPQERASLKSDDYGIILQGIADSQSRQDPVVFSMTGSKQQSQRLRKAELIAVAPDLFDMSYYSIQKNFENEFMNEKSGGFLKTLCPMGCEDFGTEIVPGTVPEQQGKPLAVANIIEFWQKNNSGFFWKTRNVNHLNTGWTQEAADKYLPEGGGVSELLAAAPDARGGEGGRVGYSVKIVSEDFLKRSLKLGGDKAGEGKIKNPPK